MRCVVFGATDPTSVRDAMSGAHYLVHLLNQQDFVDVDRRAAHVLAEAARTAGLTRLVYLGEITRQETAG